MKELVYNSQTDLFGRTFYHLKDISISPNTDIEDTVNVTGTVVTGFNKADGELKPGTLKTIHRVPRLSVQAGFHNIFDTKFKGKELKPYRGKRK